MSTFCANCGFPLSASSAFCPQCGKPAATGAAPAPSVAKAAPAASSSSAAKIVVIVLVCLIGAGVVGIGLTWYAVHRIKQTVVAKARSYGVDLPSIANSASSAAAAPASHKTYQPCDLLPKQEASNLLGEPIERAEVQDAMCLYYGPAGLSQKLATQGASDVMHRAQQPGAQVSGGEVADAVTKMVGAVAASSGQGGSQGEIPLLSLGVDPDGGPQMAAMEATKAFASAIPGVSADVPNLGDRAIWVGNLGLNVLKGGTMIRVMPGPVPQAHERAVTIARAVLPRI